MAKAVFLEFEKELGEIATKIEELKAQQSDSSSDQRRLIAQLERDLCRRTAEVYRELTPWQTALVARHPCRPYTMDYVNAIFEDFTELHGDRSFADDQSIVGGLARLGEYSVMLIGQQKGRDTRERTRRNFGMSRPEGYRKALRLMKLAEKFNLPVFTFVDTPGAYPGIDAEEHNQSEAIGRNILELSKLSVPVIATIIGEGGSGGALAIAVADVVMMLQYSTYSVISPEGCASILWKNAAKAPEAAQALGLTSETILRCGLVDKVLSEPLGGAHRDPRLMASTLKKALIDQLHAMRTLSYEQLMERRMQRLLSYGQFECQCVAEAVAPVPAEISVEAPAEIPAGVQPVLIDPVSESASAASEPSGEAPLRTVRKRRTARCAGESETMDGGAVKARSRTRKTTDTESPAS